MTSFLPAQDATVPQQDASLPAHADALSLGNRVHISYCTS